MLASRISMGAIMRPLMSQVTRPFRKGYGLGFRVII